MVKSPRQDQQRESVPTSFPETTPRSGQPSHDFTLQAVMEMQRTLGELCAKVERLGGDLKGQSDKLDAVRITMARVGGGIAVLIVLISLVAALIKFLPFGAH
jgi:hypothetical protein